MENTILFESAQTFSVPCDVVDRHLNAPDVELRLLLLLLRNTNAAFIKDDLMRTLSVDEERLEEAFKYWVKAGVLYKAAGKYTLQRPQLKASDFMTYNPETVAQRLEGDPALQYLYKEAETVLKKPLTSADASLILSLVDWCGLPADVVALLIRYGSDNGKSLRQIAQTGVRWSDDGVQTFEQAELLIRKETEKKNTVNRIASRFGILGTRAITEDEKKHFLKWKEEFHFDLDMIGAAYEATVKSTGKYAYKYINTILQRWHDSGYKTPEDIKEIPEEKSVNRKTTKHTANNPRKAATKADKEAASLAWDIIVGDSNDN